MAAIGHFRQSLGYSWMAVARLPAVSEGQCAEPPAGDLSFACHRCRAEVVEAAYGPCTRCRAELRTTLGGERREVEVEYVPKVNVTPNAVALKD